MSSCVQGVPFTMLDARRSLQIGPFGLLDQHDKRLHLRPDSYEDRMVKNESSKAFSRVN